MGALRVIELTAPGRSALVAKGLRRIGLSNRERRYFDLHAVLDVKRSETWNREAHRPLVEEDPRRAVAIAEGALMRRFLIPVLQRGFHRIWYPYMLVSSTHKDAMALARRLCADRGTRA